MNIKEYLSAAVNDKVTCTPLTYYTTQEQEGSLPWEATTVLPPAPSQHRGSCPGPVTLGGCWVGGLPVRATPLRLSPLPAYHRARFTASRPFPNAVGPQTTWRFEAPHSTPSKIDLSLLTPPKTSPRLALSSGGGIGSSARPLPRPRAPVPYATRRQRRARPPAHRQIAGHGWTHGVKPGDTGDQLTLKITPR